MNFQELESFLTKLNKYEIKQQLTGQTVNDITDAGENFNNFPTEEDSNIFRLPKNFFFSGNDLYISRHNRFAPMPEHIHDFIEINYVYRGHCTQYINGAKVELRSGDICILDRDIPHSIDSLEDDDILINILINDETFSSLFIFQIEHQHSLLTKFLADAFNQQARHDNYMHFKTNTVPFIHLQFQMMLIEYWSNQPNSAQFVNRYFQLIISELTRFYQNSQLARIHHFDYVQVLNYLDEHYSEEIKLADLSKRFKYNASYISQSLKKYTGKNFQEILLEKRLDIAYDLITTTHHTFSKISQDVGFNSTSYFFRQFKKRYSFTPKQIRMQKLTQLP